jgi:hypothetical protein
MQAKEELVSQELPKLDRNAYREKMREAFEQAMDQVAEALDNARCGRLIRDSEEKARDVLEEFRRVAYETATQMKIDAAEAAFSPSEEPGDTKADAQQGPTTDERAHCERPVAAPTHSLARRRRQRRTC